MQNHLNRFLDVLSNFFAHRKGLLPFLAILLITANFIVQFIPVLGWFADSNLLLHLGMILAIFGFLLAWAL